MNHCTVKTRERQTRRRAATTMTTEQRQSMIGWAWYYAQPIIWRWNRSRPGLDYEGYVAEQLAGHINSFDAGISSLYTWSQREANFACLDADREDTGVIHFTCPVEQKKIYPFEAFGGIDDAGHPYVPDCLAVHDGPGHLERMDDFRDLLRGCNKIERLILIGYYWHDQTMKEIGADLGLSESRISQMHAAILERLRDRLEARASA